MTRSYGIIIYRGFEGKTEVLLCHPGGPYWKCKKNFTVSKGERTGYEKAIDTAKREFKEETSFNAPSNIHYLGTKKVNKKKLVTIFYANMDIDVEKCHSNTFKLESPKGSGIIKKYPEMDYYKWFSLDDARKVIMKSQIYFINKLEDKLKEMKA